MTKDLLKEKYMLLFWFKKIILIIYYLGLLEDLREAQPNSVVILHSCAHNPTGCDPTKEEWELIAECIKVFAINIYLSF